MADEVKTKTGVRKTKSGVVGNQAIPTILDNTTKLEIDTNKVLIDNIIDAGLGGGLSLTDIDNFTSLSNNREQIYTVIDTMARDSAVSAIIKTYADSACEVADSGHIIWCESDDQKVSKFVNYLLNVMNIDKNIYGWVYCLVKYGDVYLRLYRDSDYEDELFKKETINTAATAKSLLTEDAKTELKEAIVLNVHNTSDPYSYYVEMVPDPGTMFELTKYGKTYGFIETPNEEQTSNYLMNTYNTTGGSDNFTNYRMKSADINIYQADDFVHAYLDDNYSRFPEKVEIFTSDNDYKNNQHSRGYTVKRGKSMLIDNYKVWREKTLLESSILINRVTKSNIITKVGVEVGSTPKEQTAAILRRVKELFEHKTAIKTDTSMSDYNSPGPIENKIFYATNNGRGAITVDVVGGDVNVKDIADLDSWINMFYAGHGVPKAYYGWTDDGAGFNGGTSLSIISGVFAKGVKHVQNAITQAITDIINLILINKGLKAYLNNFVLKMKAPLTQAEKDYRTDLTERISAISNMISLFSDVENKARRLAIVKNFIATLNYGDEVLTIIDEEIAAIKEKESRETAQAEEDAKKQKELEIQEANGEEPSKPSSTLSPIKEKELPPEQVKPEEPFDESPADELDLGLSSIAAMEAFETKAKTKTKKDQDLLNVDVVLDEDHLPSPEEIGEGINFTENK